MRQGLPFLLVASLMLTPAVAEAQFAVKGGLSFGLPLGNVVELRPELLFVQKGDKLSDDDSFTLNEFNIPLLLQIDIPIKGFMPYIVAGLQGEIELKCTKADVDCVDTKSLRWGAVGGVGIRLGKVFSVEGRYNWTLSEISDDIASKPRSILLLAGIHFGAKQ